MSHSPPASDLILSHGLISTRDRENPVADAVGISGGRFTVVGGEAEVMRTAHSGTRVIDCGRRRVIPGLIDSHIHMIRGGLTYNLELRWDNVRSLADAMAMLRLQVDATPPPHWVKVVGGYTLLQFEERRLPTIAELNAIAPDTPVLITHLYDRAILNGAALRACGYNRDTPDPDRARFERAADGTPTGLVIAEPDPWILYATMAKAPKLLPEQQRNSTRQFMRELNRLGVTGINDAGGGFFEYPQDFEVARSLAADGLATVRMAYNLLPQVPGRELASYSEWVEELAPRMGDAMYRHNGGGELLTYSAGDWEDFRQPRPELGLTMEDDLEAVTRLLAEHRWPFRMHATYDETIGRALDVFEKVARDIPINDLHWFFDHAETISERNIDRVAALGGGIAVQHRMAYQGEWFVERYGARVAAHTPPIRRMMAAGVPVGAGTDATRVSSHNPWMSIHWLVTGKTVAGMRLYGPDNRMSREEALDLWTRANTWFSSEEGVKGQIRAGQLADLAVLNQDYFQIPEFEIPETRSLLTILGGDVVWADGEYRSQCPDLPAATPDWSPVNRFGGVQSLADQPVAMRRRTHARDRSCGHGHASPGRFAGPGGCFCWAI